MTDRTPTQLLELAGTMAGIGHWHFDVPTGKIIWSAETYRIHGVPQSETVPDYDGLLRLYDRESAEALNHFVQRALTTGQGYDLEARIVRPDGTKRFVITKAACSFDENGKVIALFGVFQDITERVDKDRFMRALANHVPALLAYWDRNLCCVYTNQKFHEWFGRTSAEMLGMPLQDLLGKEAFARSEPRLREALAGQPYTFERTLKKPSGDIGHILARCIPDFDSSGCVQGVIVLATDVTAMKESELRLKSANETADEALSRAQAALAIKQEFLANISHEIRTPLNGVLGMAQSLDAEDLSPAQKEKVATILDSGKLLTTLLNDVLDMSKIEAGKLAIVPVPGDLLQTVARAQRLFQTQADEKGLELRISAGSNFPPGLAYDPVRVEQCLNNLISNAVKFTAEGHVTIACALERRNDGAHVIAIEVSDTGIGMSQASQAKMFSVFTQADATITRKFGGTGLGLSISRQLARLMGGDLTLVRSEAGQGSAFLLTFTAIEAGPIQSIAVEEPQLPAPTRQDLRGYRVLLTDDNAINRQVIKLFLAPLGCQITEAVNGREALDRLGSEPFDLVLLDVHMPVMDGREAIQRIRSSTEAWRDIPTIALTADAMLGDRERLLALGMTDYLPKPIDQRALVSKILGLLLGQASETDRSVAIG